MTEPFFVQSPDKQRVMPWNRRFIGGVRRDRRRDTLSAVLSVCLSVSLARVPLPTPRHHHHHHLDWFELCSGSLMTRRLSSYLSVCRLLLVNKNHCLFLYRPIQLWKWYSCSLINLLRCERYTTHEIPHWLESVCSVAFGQEQGAVKVIESSNRTLLRSLSGDAFQWDYNRDSPAGWVVLSMCLLCVPGVECSHSSIPLLFRPDWAESSDAEFRIGRNYNGQIITYHSK